MMKRAVCLLLAAVLVGGGSLVTGCTGSAPYGGSPATLDGSRSDSAQDLPLLARWNGDFPVAKLDFLPAGQRQSTVGCIADRDALAAVWSVLQPGQDLPEIDFSSQLVVFSRNGHFYNRTAIFRVTLKEGTAEVLAMETMSAMPIEDKVGMALAVIPRAGVRFITTGNERIAVP